MSFKTYIVNVETKTGKPIVQIVASAEAAGLADSEGLVTGIKAGQLASWLQSQYGLGHGHAMAVVAYINGKRTRLISRNERVP